MSLKKAKMNLRTHVVPVNVFCWGFLFVVAILWLLPGCHHFCCSGTAAFYSVTVSIASLASLWRRQIHCSCYDINVFPASVWCKKASASLSVKFINAWPAMSSLKTFVATDHSYNLLSYTKHKFSQYHLIIKRMFSGRKTLKHITWLLEATRPIFAGIDTRFCIVSTILTSWEFFFWCSSACFAAEKTQFANVFGIEIKEFVISFFFLIVNRGFCFLNLV